ncbi:MAG: penicillin-binding protein activator LpoB [Bdellovibrionales bacterium CG10_big_fil_rev_8_21_14_0_10_45_34]|nr:MAG: penicillin-binding protein activator LpoB [Bdellovibrionales bacterium CG10_big_fil_rev_8_21_14_0_10_45_34]
MSRFLLLALASFVSVAMLSSCGPKAFVKGDYDEDVESENLLTDQWSETDMQKSVKELVDSLVGHPAIREAKRQPILMVTKLQNKTSEHIDTQNITDMVTVELMGRGRVTFVNKAAREDVADEYDYQNSGMVSEETKKGPGGQISADYILDGRLDSIVQEAGNRKTVYYKLTLSLTNLKTNLMVWSNHKQMRKLYKKRSVGM